MIEVSFSFSVNTCLEQEELDRLKQAKSVDRRLEILNGIFENDPNIWDAYYEAALAAFVCYERAK